MNYNSESKQNIIVKNFPMKIKPMKWNSDMNLLRKSQEIFQQISAVFIPKNALQKAYYGFRLHL